ncbi:hypothetical protein [Cohnella soli]|uniref:Uncharacterized protein n=1 Tax=Cohnella soli TaxID=425005 RepID=A0ABW0HPG8_9BACL
MENTALSPMWSVWKHNGKDDAEWTPFVVDADAEYVRHVYRYVKEEVFKSGLLQLRCDEEVIDEFEKFRNSGYNFNQKQDSEVGAVKEIKDPRFDGYRDIEKLSAINSVVQGLFLQYRAGACSYKQFLEHAVIKLHYEHLLSKHGGDELAQEDQSMESLTNKAALEKFNQLLITLGENLDRAEEVLRFFTPNPAYEMMLSNVSRNVRALIYLHPEYGISNSAAEEVIALKAKEMIKEEKAQKLERREKKKKEKGTVTDSSIPVFGVSAIKRPRGRPRKNQ